ncbi:MAG: MBL fold metallo-hydrolase [Phycisphaerales bacterium]|nr:MBL fold metallo-hydrolase [Phycisphaerales bacterium]
MTPPNSTLSTLRIEPFTMGPFATNCFVVWVEDETECWIIDASFEPQPIIDAVRSKNLEPSRILLTHAHADHIAGLEQVKAAFPNARVAIHPDEASWLTDPVANLSASQGWSLTPGPPDEAINHDERLTLAGHNFRVIHVPGHSPGSCCFYSESDGVAISGDALFAGSIGRTDFPTANHDLLIRSIKERLYTLPDDTIVLPGHGPDTTIGRERTTNPFVRG